MLKKDADHGHYYNWVSYAHDLRVRYEIQQSDTRSIIKYEIIKHFQSEVPHGLNKHITDNRKLNLYHHLKHITNLSATWITYQILQLDTH